LGFAQPTTCAITGRKQALQKGGVIQYFLRKNIWNKDFRNGVINIGETRYFPRVLFGARILLFVYLYLNKLAHKVLIQGTWNIIGANAYFKSLSDDFYRTKLNQIHFPLWTNFTNMLDQVKSCVKQIAHCLGKVLIEKV
jgi:hypothetical protein